MEKKNKLKEKKIYIENDLTRKGRKIKREIWEKARKERNTGSKVKISYKKLLVEKMEMEMEKISSRKRGEGCSRKNFERRRIQVERKKRGE